MSMLKLIKMQLNVAYGFSVLRWYWRHNKAKFFANAGLFLLILLSLGPIFYLYWRMLDGLYLGAAMFGQGQVVLTTGLVGGSLIVFLFGIAYIMSTFYFSRDLNFLLALPVKPGAVMASKFSVVLLSNYITLIPFVIPAVLVYGFYNGFSVAYVLMSVILFVLVPFIPLALASILVMLLMRFSNLSRRRDTIRMAGMIGFVLIIVFLNIFLSQIPEGQEAEYIQNLLSQNEGLVSYISRIFPPAILATRALINTGMKSLLNFFYYFGTSVFATWAAVTIGSRVFYQGLIGGSEVTTRKSLSAESLDKKLSRSQHPAVAIASREIKYLLRTPIYFFNSVAVIVLVPALILIPMVVSGGWGQIQELITMLDSRLLLILALAGFIGATALFAPASSSSFSREGKTFWISKVIPVQPLVQIHGKILYSYLISLLAMPLVGLAVIFIIPLSILEVLIVFLLGTAFTLPIITSSLLIDFLRPYLNWDDPQRAIKQNMNVLIGLGVGSALLYLIFLVVQMTRVWGWNDSSVMIAAGTASILVGLVPYLIMKRIAVGQYNRIEI